ncbi:hypothetical protein [Halalkalibacter oceani]|uniref:hypothetical protein n=1 Tax=Halalkalibacter oceani TaxID=1653776 RepID=UPI0033936F4A
MKYSILRNDSTNKDLFREGCFLINSHEELHTVIYDRDRGYAILNLVTYNVESEFYETIELFVRSTTITEMTPVEQVNEVKFEEI